jgi:hypothetical protein
MHYVPFDDTQTHTRPPSPTKSGYYTSEFDIYRQGIEITTNKFRFLGSQPKLWSGETSGFSEVVTYGQNPGAIEGNVLGLGSKFEDMPKFDPVAYLSLGVAYPLPIIFNDGPSEEGEATIEPLAIPFKKPSNEGPYYAHAIRGSYEDGNIEGWVVKSTNIVEQFIDMRPGSDTRFFLDQGADYFGNIPRDPYVADVGFVSVPFDDAVSYSPDNKLQTNNSIFHEVIQKGSEMEEVDFLPYGKKSSAAGFSCYGLNSGQYGTDSIVFAGWVLGS